MRLSDILSKHGLTNLKIKTPYLEADFELKQSDRDAAWELYVELLTRCATQKLPDNSGDESAALESLHALFSITREIMKKYKCDCIQFSKIAVVILNQVIRPFTSKWHRKYEDMCADRVINWENFRSELKDLQNSLSKYMHLLADMANVEDISSIENV